MQKWKAVYTSYPGNFFGWDVHSETGALIAKNLSSEAAHVVAAAPELLALAIKASDTDGTLVGQAATWIGGVVDAFKMTGGNKDSGERLYTLLHELNTECDIVIAKAKGKHNA